MQILYLCINLLQSFIERYLYLIILISKIAFMNKEIISAILEKNPNAGQWSELLCELLPLYEINNNLRISNFLAQTCHESNYYLRLEESLNYSVHGLSATWSSRFPTDIAEKYGRTASQEANQAAIANIAYQNRMGNGNEASGDGYKYRGRGLIQLTGKDNYQRFSHDVFNDDSLVNNPDLITKEKKIAIHSAAWFWKINNINSCADQNDVRAVSKKINGGTIGLEERKQLTEDFKRKLDNA